MDPKFCCVQAEIYSQLGKSTEKTHHTVSYINLNLIGGGGSLTKRVRCVIMLLEMKKQLRQLKIPWYAEDY